MGAAKIKELNCVKQNMLCVLILMLNFMKIHDELTALSSKYNDYSILAPISDDIKYPNYKINNKK